MIELKFRSEKKGDESQFLNSFLESNFSLTKEDLDFLVFKEMYTEVGFPDALIVLWPKKIKINWCKERNDLTRKDIQILHHISIKSSNGISSDRLSSELGFSSVELKKTLTKLIQIDLIEQVKNNVKIKNFKENFFIKEIVAIEAKLNKIKEAVSQADLNQNFSSRSFVLLPEKKRKNSFLNFQDCGVGFITYNGKEASMKKKAKKNSLPRSYFSWVLNEHIGRMVYSGE